MVFSDEILILQPSIGGEKNSLNPHWKQSLK